ncbi:protein DETOXIFICATION 56-like [Wolffia australiana]
MKEIARELQRQFATALPLALTNLAWFARTAITTLFLSRLGDAELAGGLLGSSFANVTGFSVLTGLAGAVEPVYGQAHGAANRPLLLQTLTTAVALLLCAAAPLSLLWLAADPLLLLLFPNEKPLCHVARAYVAHLLPALPVTALLAPLRAYLTFQGDTLPVLLSSLAALAVHVAATWRLSLSFRLRGVAVAFWLSDLCMALLLLFYVVINNSKKKKDKEERAKVEKLWLRLAKLGGPCCLATCLEWWCYETLILMAGKLPRASTAIAVLGLVLNLDYLFYAGMMALGSSAGARVAYELGGAGARVAVFGVKSAEVAVGVKKAVKVAAAVDAVSFPLVVLAGIGRGMGRPWLGVWANVCGFYLVGLPLGGVLGIRVRLGVAGLLVGALVGAVVAVCLLGGLVLGSDWEEQARKAQELVRRRREEEEDGRSLGVGG